MLNRRAETASKEERRLIDSMSCYVGAPVRTFLSLELQKHPPTLLLKLCAVFLRSSKTCGWVDTKRVKEKSELLHVVAGVLRLVGQHSHLVKRWQGWLRRLPPVSPVSALTFAMRLLVHDVTARQRLASQFLRPCALDSG